MDPTPLKIKLSADGGVGVWWDDDHYSLYPYSYLRSKCPCASCQPQAPETVKLETSLPILGQQQMRTVAASPIGHYAVQFRWSDGHQAGIYSFAYLRQLCRCHDCNRAKKSS